jgi:iron complex outermembrane receptor protein
LDGFGGNATVEVGNFNLRHYTGVVNAPIVDDVLGVRIAGNRYERDGYFSAKGGALESTDAKAKILYRPNDDFSLLFGFALQNNDTNSGGTTISLKQGEPDTFVFTDTPIGKGSNDFRQYWAELNWNLGFANLTYQPAYRTWESNAATTSVTPFGRLDSTFLIPRDRFHTQELRLSSNPDSTLIWQAGTLYYENSLASHTTVTVTQFGTTIVPINALMRDKTTHAAGVFAEATYPVADTWRVTAGVRYDHTKVSVVEDYTLSPA